MQHGPELFDAYIATLRTAYEASIEATGGKLAVLTMFYGFNDGGQRRVDIRILAPQVAIDSEGQTAIITQMLSDGLEVFLFHDAEG